jgi:hypothetical protein
MCVWRWNTSFEAGYSSVDLDDAVSNLLQRPQTVSTVMVAIWVVIRCPLLFTVATTHSAKHAVQANDGRGRAYWGHCRAEAALQAALHDDPGDIQQVDLGLAQALQGAGMVTLRLQHR